MDRKKIREPRNVGGHLYHILPKRVGGREVLVSFDVTQGNFGVAKSVLRSGGADLADTLEGLEPNEAKDIILPGLNGAKIIVINDGDVFKIRAPISNAKTASTEARVASAT